jgi:hypothetical protein
VEAAHAVDGGVTGDTDRITAQELCEDYAEDVYRFAVGAGLLGGWRQVTTLNPFLRRSAPLTSGGSPNASPGVPAASAIPSALATILPGIFPTATPSPSPRSGATPASNPGPGARPRPPVNRTTAAGAVTFCVESYPPPPANRAGWCWNASEQDSSPAGSAYGFSFVLNHDSSQPTTDLTFNTSQEADFEVFSNDLPVWKWSQGQVFAQTPHSVHVNPGDQTTWRIWWDGHLDDGTRLPAGSYTLRTICLARELKDPNTGYVYGDATFKVQ